MSSPPQEATHPPSCMELATIEHEGALECNPGAQVGQPIPEVQGETPGSSPESVSDAQIEPNSISQTGPSATSLECGAVEPEDEEGEALDSEEEYSEAARSESDDEPYDDTGYNESNRDIYLGRCIWNNNHRRARVLRGILCVRHHPYSRQKQPKKNIRFSDDTKLSDAGAQTDPRLIPVPPVNPDIPLFNGEVHDPLSGVDPQADQSLCPISPMRESVTSSCINPPGLLPPIEDEDLE